MTGSPSDHDLLITHSGQLQSACEMIRDTNKTLTDFIVKIDARCETRKTETTRIQENSMRTSTFWKILTILVVILMAMLGAMGHTRDMVLRNETRIENLTKLTEDNGRMLNQLLRGLVLRPEGHTE